MRKVQDLCNEVASEKTPQVVSPSLPAEYQTAFSGRTDAPEVRCDRQTDRQTDDRRTDRHTESTTVTLASMRADISCIVAKQNSEPGSHTHYN